MNPNNDQDLRDLFAGQRSAENDQVPDYRLMLQRSDVAARQASFGVPGWRLGIGVSVAAMVTALLLTPKVSTPPSTPPSAPASPAHPSLVQMLPVLLPPARKAEVNLLVKLPVPAETESPSDFLLPGGVTLKVL